MSESVGPPFSGTAPSSTSSPDPSSRPQFALTGPSVKLDARTHAVRGDLADVRLADQVFAPHYAQAMTCVVLRATALTARPDGGDPVATLATGDAFELLELAGSHAWGVATGPGLVGYCDRTALVLA